MIEKLRLKKFQLHDRQDVDVDPLVTCIVCRTDGGKSALLRALRWVCLNDRRGGSFIGDWGKAPYTLVKLTIDGHVVSRKKGKGVNQYKLDEKVFAFGPEGQKVPEEIASLLNIGPHSFQKQHDAPHWLSDTAGKVSRELNAIVDLSVLDEALSRTASALKNARAEVGVSKKRLQEAEAKQQELQWVPTYVAAVAALVDLEEKQQEVRGKANRLEILLCEIQKAALIIEQPLPDVSALIKGQEDLRAVSRQRQRLEVLLNEISAAETILQQASMSLQEAEEELHKAQVGKCPVCGKEMD